MEGPQRQQSLAAARASSSSLDKDTQQALRRAPVSSPLAGMAANAEHPLRMASSLPKQASGSEAWDVSFTQPAEPGSKPLAWSSLTPLESDENKAQQQTSSSLIDL